LHDAPPPDWRHPFRDMPFLATARDGSPRHLLISALPMFDTAAEVFVGVRATAEDLTRRRSDEERLSKLSMAVEQNPTAVVITDRNGVIEYVNQSFVVTTGYLSEEVLGRTPAILKSGHMPRSIYCDMWKALTAGQQWRGELYNRKKSGEGYWEYTVISPILDKKNVITHFVAVKENVTERKKFEEERLRQGNEDAVTGLPNRVLALDRLEQTLVRIQRTGSAGALLMIDLDQFKRVNDVLGHIAADTILREAGGRLTAAVRPEDTVARLGGNEFCVIAGDCNAGDVEGMTRRILREFGTPFSAAGHEIFVTPSVGVTVFPDDGRVPSDLMRNADTAVYRVKEMGGNAVQFFTPDMNQRANERARLEAGLHHALDRGELQMYYQPMIDIASGQVTGAEALMRWNSAEFGHIPPDRFIPLAETSGLIVRLGSWALKTACLQAAEWRDTLGPNFRMAVNVSPRQIRQREFAELVLRTIEDTGILPHNIEIEITENLLMDSKVPSGHLNRLRSVGVSLSIDDFGTGYSSLSYLKRFPVDTLKIDRSFMSDLAGRGTDAALVETIISMAQCLKLQVVAEGVETHAQLEALKTLQCNFAQGFLFSGPVPASAFLETLPKGTTPLNRT
ncbi:MAG TPA: EAL domain-containing protein, partial [Telmatospirillum sp.]|nr:EAL domain-containing protein [Telmatospirillum sp.]